MHHRSAARSLLAALLAFPALAFAGASGVGIPETGGQGAGAASGDARGLSANPAAAAGERGSELALDAGFLLLSATYERAPYQGTGTTADPNRSFAPIDTQSMAVVPYAAIRTGAVHPKLGFGFSASVPFGRNVHFSGNGPGRYHVVTADYHTVYLQPAFAFRPNRWLRVGAGPVVGVTELRLRQRIDLAPTLQILAPGDPAVPPESGLLEGEFFVRRAQGVSYGYSAGALVDLGDRATLGLGFLSNQQVHVRGRSHLVPSRDLTLYTRGNFDLTQNLPFIVNGGGRVRLDAPWELSLEGQYVGWSVNRYYHFQITDSEIASSNADMQDLMDFFASQGFDLNESDVVENIFDKDEYLARGHRNTWNVIAGAEHSGRTLRTRVQLGFDRSAIPDENVNLGNVDFDSVVLGAGTTWAPASARYEVGVSWSQYVAMKRSVKNSRFSSHNGELGYAYPSGNGDYSAVLSRIALNLAYRF